MAATAPSTRPLLAKSRLLRFICSSPLRFADVRRLQSIANNCFKTRNTVYTALTTISEQVLFHVSATLIGGFYMARTLGRSPHGPTTVQKHVLENYHTLSAESCKKGTEHLTNGNCGFNPTVTMKTTRTRDG